MFVLAGVDQSGPKTENTRCKISSCVSCYKRRKLVISHHLVRNGLLKSKSSLRPKFQPGHLDKHYHWAHTLHRGGKFPKNADFAPDSGSLGVWNVCLDNDFFKSMGGFCDSWCFLWFLFKYGRFRLDMVCFKKYARFSWQMISIKLWEVSVW